MRHADRSAEAGSQIGELVRLAEAGEEIVLTRAGRAAVKLMPVTAGTADDDLSALLAWAQVSGASNATPGPSAARSQDFLYDEYGLPK